MMMMAGNDFAMGSLYSHCYRLSVYILMKICDRNIDIHFFKSIFLYRTSRKVKNPALYSTIYYVPHKSTQPYTDSNKHVKLHRNPLLCVLPSRLQKW